MDANAPLPEDVDNAGPVDSDEEKDAVMAAVARSRPQPLEQHIFVPTRRKYQLVRMKEMLGNALGGGGIFGAPGVGAAGGSSSGGPFSGSAGSAGPVFTATANAGSGAEAGSAVSTTGPWSEGATEGARRASAAAQPAASSAVLPQRVVTAAVGPGSRKVSAAVAAVPSAA